jgi:hypothetical protein
MKREKNWKKCVNNNNKTDNSDEMMRFLVLILD